MAKAMQNQQCLTCCLTNNKTIGGIEMTPLEIALIAMIVIMMGMTAFMCYKLYKLARK